MRSLKISFPGDPHEFWFLKPRGSKYGFPKIPHPHSTVPRGPREAKSSLFYSKIGSFWVQKIFGMFNPIMFIYKNKYILQKTFRLNQFSKSINQFIVYFLHPFLPLHIHKIMKIMFPQNPEKPQGKYLCSQKPRRTKKMIPHFPQTPGKLKD